MFRKRWFRMLIAIAFVLVAAFAVREGIAKANIVSQPNGTMGSGALDCASLPSRHSLHTETVEETGTRLPYTEDGPTGIDGGLINLLSNYRTCSR